MKKIDWETPKEKSNAYIHLMKVFGASKASVSLAMNFKRNSLKDARMRHVAIDQLGGILLSDEKTTARTVKVLNSKGEVVKAVVIENQITL